MFERMINDELWMLDRFSESRRSRISTLAFCFVMYAFLITIMILGDMHDHHIIETLVVLIAGTLNINIAARLYALIVIYPKKRMWEMLKGDVK